MPAHPKAIIFPSTFPRGDCWGRTEEMGSLEVRVLCFCVRICLMGGPDTSERTRESRGGPGGRRSQRTCRRSRVRHNKQGGHVSVFPRRRAARARRRSRHRGMTDADGTNNLSFRRGARDSGAARAR